MPKTISSYVSHLVSNLNTVLLFGILFMGAGYIIPTVYYRYFDTTEYYKIKTPIEVEQRDYYPCEYAKIYLVRNSLINGQGRSIINLELIEDSGVQKRVETTIKEISFTEGEGLIILNWEISCKASPGKHYFQGTMSYQVRGFQKYTPFKTTDFNIIASESTKVKDND